jgi:hypothetical protein
MYKMMNIDNSFFSPSKKAACKLVFINYRKRLP